MVLWLVAQPEHVRSTMPPLATKALLKASFVVGAGVLTAAAYNSRATLCFPGAQS
jgi:hypothetical protein